MIPKKTLRSGFEMPIYGLGLWQMGGRWESDSSKDDDEVHAIKAALDAGVTHIDAAESYGNGHAEELLGKALLAHDRSKLFIATKVSGGNQSYEGVMKAFDASINRIKTDYIDLYLLHRYPDAGISIVDTMRAMDELVASGRVKNIGVCNMTPVRFDEVQNHTINKLVCNQLHYNVQYREIEKYKLAEHAIQKDYFLSAWRPLQKGDVLDCELLISIGKKYGKTPAQIAINWLTSQQNVITLSKTSNLRHLQDNLGALDFTMSVDDIELIRREYPNQKDISDAVPLNY